MSSTNYIPPKDQDLAAWANNFSDLITANPPLYGLVTADAASIGSYVSTFIAALAIATNPSTRTKPAVADKDGARAAMLDIVRPYAQQIRNNLGVTDENKTALGLTVRDLTPTPIPPPSSNPLVNPIGGQPGVLTVRYADSNTPDSRGKPFGVVGMQLFVNVGLTAVTDPNLADFKQFVTRQPVGVNFTSGEAGKVATFFARWQNAKGDVGPWSSPVSAIIM